MEIVEKTKKTNSFLELIILEPDSDLISEALGMTEERFEELGNHVMDIIKKEKESKFSFDLHKLSLFAKHANELALMCMFYGKNFGKMSLLSDIADIDPEMVVKLGYEIEKRSKGTSEE